MRPVSHAWYHMSHLPHRPSEPKKYLIWCTQCILIDQKVGCCQKFKKEPVSVFWPYLVNGESDRDGTSNRMDATQRAIERYKCRKDPWKVVSICFWKFGGSPHNYKAEAAKTLSAWIFLGDNLTPCVEVTLSSRFLLPHLLCRCERWPF